MQNYNFVKNDVFVAKICKYALYESSEGLFCARRKPANFCHPASLSTKGYLHETLLTFTVCTGGLRINWAKSFVKGFNWATEK